MKTPIYSMLLVLVASFIGAFGALMLKKSSKKISRNIRQSLKNRSLFAAIFLYGISTIIFLFALKQGELSVLYPFVATTYVWISILSVKFLGEKMNILKLTGIFAIIMGVVLIGLGS